MSQVWFCSDLHLGHKNINKFRAPFINSTEENNERIFTELEKHVGKRDILWCLGDWCFDRQLVDRFRAISCIGKVLTRGNHDVLDNNAYYNTFDTVHGITKKYGFWLSHAPIHPDELRGIPNLHGHVHYASINDQRYFNCCPENLWPKYDRCVVSLDEVRKFYGISS